MTRTSKTVVFFGSGPVAAKSLELLVNNFTIEAVVTKPRAAHHKGDVPVLRIAEEFNIPVKTVSNKKELDALIETSPFESDVSILIDFGIIVSQKVIDYFKFGILNSHFSLLPEWRGADPITFSILSGQKTTGVSLMLLTAGMDEGPLLGYAPFELSDSITTPTLTDELIELSYHQLITLVPKYLQGEIIPAPQDDAKAPTYSRKLTKSDANIDWQKPADEIERQIRAFIEWPKTRCTINGLEAVLTSAHVIDLSGIPGTFEAHNKQLIAYCGRQALVIDTLKPAGKKEMTGQSFLAGYRQYL